MRYLSTATVFCIIIVMFAGCGDFLERAPSGLLDEKETFTNFKNAEAFLNNAYAELPNLLFREDDLFSLGSATDEAAYFHRNRITSTMFNKGTLYPTAFPLMSTWKTYYASIRRCNTFLKNFELIPEEVGGENFSDKRRRMYGEAHALRAYYYFLLFSLYRNIPYIDSVLDPSDNACRSLPQEPVDDLIEKIDRDLTVAEEYLSTKYAQSELGRITLPAVKAIRSRMYLYYASPLLNESGDVERWRKAERHAEEAIEFAEGNGYALSLTPKNGSVLDAYGRIFHELENPEILWSSGSTRSWGLSWDSFFGSRYDGGGFREGPLQELVDSYEMQNGELPVLGYTRTTLSMNGEDVPGGIPIVNPMSGYNPQNPYINRDKRFYQTILYHGCNWKSKVMDVSYTGPYYDKNILTNYYFRKGITEEHNLQTGSGNQRKRFILFRLAEMYLNYAEARNENLSAPDQKVYDVVNVLRKRAGLPDLPSGLNKEQMRERIRHERRVELAMENHRFYDVRRWKIAEEVDNTEVHYVFIKNGVFSYPVWEERLFDKKKHYWLPIPQEEINKNRKLRQNPGWDFAD